MAARSGIHLVTDDDIVRHSLKDESEVATHGTVCEDRTKQHYMWEHDPEYVKEMMTPNFDPHIDLAVFAGALTEEQGLGFRNGEEEFKHNKIISGIRKVYKGVNYAAVYGAGVPTLARTANVTEREAKKLREAYWARNWSVKAIAESTKVKTIAGQMWQYNPVSKLWYTLRYEKDRFSTLNQGTGVYCFDKWVENIMELGGPPIIGQFHDEVICLIKKVDKAREMCHNILKGAVGVVNEQLRLNRDLDCDVQFNDSYAGIH